MVMETGPSVRARLSSAEAAGAEATEEAVEEAAVLPPQADSRPAAPSAGSQQEVTTRNCHAHFCSPPKM